MKPHSNLSPEPAVRLDPLALARLRELDPGDRHGVLVRVLSAFESSLTRLLAQLQAELQGGHADVVSGLAHTLKSSAASVGALELARACAEVERKLRAGQTAELESDISRLIADGHAAMAAVGAILRP